QLLQERRNHLARAAPFGPEVDHDRDRRLEHVGLERVVTGRYDRHAGDSTAVGSALGGKSTGWPTRASRRGGHARFGNQGAESTGAYRASSASSRNMSSGPAVHNRAERTVRPG